MGVGGVLAAVAGREEARAKKVARVAVERAVERVAAGMAEVGEAAKEVAATVAARVAVETAAAKTEVISPRPPDLSPRRERERARPACRQFSRLLL